MWVSMASHLRPNRTLSGHRERVGPGAEMSMSSDVPVTRPDVFEFTIEVLAADLTDTANPVSISFVIGDDVGAAKVRVPGSLSF